jgi:adenine deaminase
MNLDTMLQAARGERTLDLLLTNARIVNVFSREIVSGSIAIADGTIVGFSDGQARQTLDLDGRFVAPGFIDPHVHIESSMTCVSEFARAVGVHGTTTVIADPHEIANVCGTEGIRYMLQSAADQPINIYYTLPSCVPATTLETSGARLEADDLAPLMGHERVVGLGEVMNYPAVINADPQILAKLALARKHAKTIEGHSPGLSGSDLTAYIAAGVQSDHECTSASEAREKLSAGMAIMIRQGTAARNLKQLLPIVTEKTAHRTMWCTDDRHPHDLLQGHIDSIVREAIGLGLSSLIAIQMATINAAEYYGLKHLGAIAPGRQADLVIFSDLAAPVIEEVYCRGNHIASRGCMFSDIPRPASLAAPPSMKVRPDLLDLTVPVQGQLLRVIEIVPDQIITRQRLAPPTVVDNLTVSDPERDLLKIAVVERHTGSERVGKGFVSGFGLQRGALASSVAHDSHNIIVVGASDADMRTAVAEVVEMGGGLAAVCNCRAMARLPLPVAGLMSLEPVEVVDRYLQQVLEAARELGSHLSDPFMTLSFLALPVIPELKITDRGLIDAVRFEPISLFAR